MNTEERYILLWLTDTIPSIRGKVFAMADIPLEFDSEHSEMIHTYLKYKYKTSSHDLTQEIIIDLIKNNRDITPLQERRIVHNKDILRIINGCKGYKNVSYNGLKYTYISLGFEIIIEDDTMYFGGSGDKWPYEIELKYLFLDGYDTMMYFRKKSLENNGWIKRYNPNYVLEMTTKYMNSIMNNMELYMKNAYLYASISHMGLLEESGISRIRHDRDTEISGLEATEDDYNKLYDIIIKYIHNNS